MSQRLGWSSHGHGSRVPVWTASCHPIHWPHQSLHRVVSEMSCGGHCSPNSPAPESVPNPCVSVSEGAPGSQSSSFVPSLPLFALAQQLLCCFQNSDPQQPRCPCQVLSSARCFPWHPLSTSCPGKRLLPARAPRATPSQHSELSLLWSHGRSASPLQRAVRYRRVQQREVRRWELMCQERRGGRGPLKGVGQEWADA